MQGFGGDLGSSFPRKTFVQRFADGRMPPESQLVVQELCRRAGADGLSMFGSKQPILVTTEEFNNITALELSSQDFVVGDFDWTRKALSICKKPFPPACDYPPCLQHLLYRKVWKSSLGELLECVTENTKMFIKPFVETKAFSGLMVSKDWLSFLLEQLPPTFLVWCSEVVEIVSESRVYVLHGKIIRTCFYAGKKDGDGTLDMKVVEDAVKTLGGDPSSKALMEGCGIDFAVFKLANGTLVTGLVEVNEGFSLGAYEGISAGEYTDLLMARWQSLMK